VIDVEVLVEQVLELIVLIVKISSFLDQFLTIQKKLIVLGRNFIENLAN
jgi:hypothetical protein